jgi:hypothetical protein
MSRGLVSTESADPFKFTYVDDLDMEYLYDKEGYPSEPSAVNQAVDSNTSPLTDNGDLDRRPFALTRAEVISLAVHDMAIKFKGQREYVAAQRKSLEATGPANKPLDYRTVRARVSNMTGLTEQRFDCCVKGCMSYAMYPDLDCCRDSDCNHPRWKPDKNGKNIPYQQHAYLPITERLPLWWGNISRATQMVNYRRKAESDRTIGKRTDFWSGDLFQDLKSKDLFGADTDIALTLSTDGVKVFKSRRAFNIWPLMLLCLNLPPEVRFKRRNVLFVGFIPGPANPKDMYSFLFPLLQELRQLEKGKSFSNHTACFSVSYFPLNLSVVSSLAVVSFPGQAARAPDGQCGSSSARTPCFRRRSGSSPSRCAWSSSASPVLFVF